jgi:uncharacterized protein (TIGR03435 family)
MARPSASGPKPPPWFHRTAGLGPTAEKPSSAAFSHFSVESAQAAGRGLKRLETRAKWPRPASPLRGFGIPTRDAQSQNAGGPDQADVFANIREVVRKLGLRIDPAKALGESLVIEEAEKPSEN